MAYILWGKRSGVLKERIRFSIHHCHWTHTPIPSTELPDSPPPPWSTLPLIYSIRGFWKTTYFAIPQVRLHCQNSWMNWKLTINNYPTVQRKQVVNKVWNSFKPGQRCNWQDYGKLWNENYSKNPLTWTNSAEQNCLSWKLKHLLNCVCWGSSEINCSGCHRPCPRSFLH